MSFWNWLIGKKDKDSWMGEWNTSSTTSSSSSSSSTTTMPPEDDLNARV